MKIGLVLEGGSRKCMFTAGVIDALLDEKIEFPYVAGISAGAHGAVNFITKQRGRLRYVLTPSKLREGKWANALLDGVQREFRILNYVTAYGKYALDFDALFNSPVEYEIGMTCAETGECEYKTERENQMRLLDILNATSSLPMFFPLAKLDGRHYADGCVTDSIPFQRAFEKGCDKVFVISTKVPGDKATDFKRHRIILSPMYEKKYPKLYEACMVRYERYVAQVKEMERFQAEGKILVFKPEIELCKLFETKYDKLEDSYLHGFRYAMKRMDELKDFMGLEKE